MNANVPVYWCRQLVEAGNGVADLVPAGERGSADSAHPGVHEPRDAARLLSMHCFGAVQGLALA